MSKILNPETFGEKLYNRLPNMYRTADAENEYDLKRYLLSLNDGGFSKVIDEMNGLLDIPDPERTPAKCLKYLFGEYGVTMFQGVDEKLLRKLLQILADIFARKGTESVIFYISSILTGCECTLNYVKQDGAYLLKISFEAEDEEHLLSDADKEFLESILKDYVPFYWNVVFDSYIASDNEYGSLKIDTDYFTSIHVTGDNETTPLVFRESEVTDSIE